MTTATIESLVSVNPATNEPVGEIAVTSLETIEEVLHRARAASGTWAAMSLEDRLTILKGAIPVLEARAEEIDHGERRQL